MSKLTDKIEALLRIHTVAGPDAPAVRLGLRDILADVRELEHDLTNGAAYANGYADGQDDAEVRERDVDDAIRQAKREAYEHACEIIEHNTRYHALQTLSSLVSDASDTEETSNE